MKHNLSKLIFLPIIHLIVGQIIPIAFIYLDFNELGLPWSKENALDIYKSQTIYPFSSIIFPAVFVLLHLLIERTRNQKKFYQNILNQMNENIIVFDLNQKAIYENNATIKSNIKNKMPDLLIHKERLDIFEWSVTENEITRHFLVNFKNDQLNSTLMLIMKDVSDLIKKEEFIKQQELTIIRNSKLASLGEIAAGIAHEINNPLSVIIGNVEMIDSQLTEPQDEIRKNLSTITRMGKRISNIIKLMKNLSREDHGSQNELIEMSSFMEDIKCLINISIKSSCVDMALDISSFKDEHIRGNSTQLSQVLINLINNAVQAIETDEEKWIKVLLVKDPDFLTLQICNSGVKISNEVKKKIFQPFFTTKDPGKGTGLGLSISKSIIEGHHGTLVLDDESQNTTFVIRLPKARLAEAA
jgi:signal transduction histidine kinase